MTADCAPLQYAHFASTDIYTIFKTIRNSRAFLYPVSYCRRAVILDYPKIVKIQIVLSNIHFNFNKALFAILSVVVFNSYRWRYYQMQPKQFGNKG